MAFVVDASVALSWFLPGEATDETDEVLQRLLGEQATVPALWRLEVANVLVQKQVRGSLSAADVERIASLMLALPIRIEEPGAASVKALVAAGVQHGLTSYDAEYLLLAQREGLALATLDRRLAEAAQASGVELVIHS